MSLLHSANAMENDNRLDLSPARWIWLPSERTLANTFVLFRKEWTIAPELRKLTGWISADSRYRLTVNGSRVQWGPAPCDPRWTEADPVDLTSYVRQGRNVIGVEVLYFGAGDGTWPAGRPGLLLRLEAEYADGTTETAASDDSWLAYLDRAHRPGQYRRWFLRALQEEFDARLHPQGWDTPEFVPDDSWVPALVLRGRADLPAVGAGYWDYANPVIPMNREQLSLSRRSIPLMAESDVGAMRLAEQGTVRWRRNPSDWFEFRMPDSFETKKEPVALPDGNGRWKVHLASSEAVFLTFEMREQIVGWPRFTIEAPAGTIVELICQESHDPDDDPWLDSHFYNWSRFVCRDGINRFETFDFESLRWMQLHIRNAAGPVTVSGVGVRRRMFPWPNRPAIRCDEPLQRLFEASVNTLYNSAQETCVDGMGRERQPYSGDGGHQLHAVRYVFGEYQLPARFLRTFSQGLTIDGYFMDAWPAFDRLHRIAMRTVELSDWGPLLDHGVGFVFDCYHHFMFTGDLEALREPYPRLIRFCEYLCGLIGEEGMIPVQGLGIPAVWIDHEAYKQQKHKQCAFNLYAAAMLQSAMSELAAFMGDAESAEKWRRLGREIVAAAVAVYWSAEEGMFVCNLPWADEETEIRLCDRSLSTALLYGFCPDEKSGASIEALATRPENLGISYPCNAGWRYWALAACKRADVVIEELRSIWAVMPSVTLNNTLQEYWTARPDSGEQWSHCAVVPLYSLYMDILGLKPLAPGFASCLIRPQLGDLSGLDVTAYTPRGPIRFVSVKSGETHRMDIHVPEGIDVVLDTPDNVTVRLVRGA